MQNLYRLIFLLFSLSVFSQNNYAISNLSSELLDGANSVLVDELIEVDVSEAKKMIYSSHRVVSILNKRGDKDTDTSLFYDDFTKIKDAEVYVYDASGKEIKHFNKRDFRDVSAADGISLYVDSRVLYLNYTPSSYPYTLVFNAKVESSSTGFVYGWLPLGAYASSTKKSVYKLKFDPTNKPRIRTSNFEGFNISVTEGPNEYIYEAINAPAIRYENYSKPFNEIAPLLKVALDKFYLKGVEANAKNWNEFGLWMQNSLLYDVQELPDATILMIKNLVANETTNIAKARKIYQYLQDKVRYISVQIGIGGWKPMLASDVDKLGYGDCKALTNYTKVLLDAVGIPSYYTILYAGDSEMDIIDNFSSIQGNHALLGLPDGDNIIWLECTSQDAPFGFGGNFSDDRDVLIVTPEGGKIVHTKIYTAQDSKQETKGSIVLKDDGSISSNFSVISTGLKYGDKFRLEKETRDDLIKAYKSRWSYINGLHIEDAKVDNNKIDIIFNEKLIVGASNYASKVGEDFLFAPNVFSQSQSIPPRITDRKQDLYISEGFTEIDQFDIILPDNFSVDSLPDDTPIETKFGTYTISFSEVTKHKIVLSRSLIINKGTFPPEDYKAYRSFRKKIAKLDKSKVLVKLKTT